MTDRRKFAEILDEYLKALEAGNTPDREALLARHADIAEELRAALLGIDLVHGAAPRLAPDEHADALPGGLLGDYRLLRELGRGGMAVVYEAEQVSLGRHVALKVLPFAAVLDPKQLQRFKNEAMAAAHLRHPNIVPVYGVGCERGVHYYAMQYVEGQSLAAAIRDMKGGGVVTADGPKTPISSHGSNRDPAYIRMAAALGVQAAEALDHAHQLGIVHRDVKPGNLLADLAGTLWVADFGLATSMKDVSLTITGELLGTIRYMSPEQALAKRVPVDHRTDVYSLGATLYELFTLEPAFPGDDPHRVIQDIAFKEPVLPHRLNPALPRDLETVILKAMWKDPAGRYATAQEMADDLTRFLENRPIEAKRPGLLRRASKWSRRHRTLVGATMVLLLLSTAGLATGTALLWREQARTKDAFENAQANLQLALKALDQIYIDEAEGSPKIREGLPKDLLRKGLGFYEAFVKENARNKDLVSWMGVAYLRAGLIFRELGEEEHAVESFKGAVSAYDRALEIDARDTGAHQNRGVALSHLGRCEDALAAFDQTLEIDPRYAASHISRGKVLCDQLGRPGEALAEFDLAIELNPRNGMAHNNRGNALHYLRRFEEGLAACDLAIDIDPRHTMAHNSRAAILIDLKRFKEALAACDRAIDIEPRLSMAHSNRGVALTGLGRFEDALAAFDRALEIDPRNARFHSIRGITLEGIGCFEQALAAYDCALEINPRDAWTHRNRGAALEAMGDLETAIGEYRLAIQLQPDSAPAHNSLGLLLLKFGDADGAIREHRETLRTLADEFAPHLNLGNALLAAGDIQGAVASYSEAIRLKPDSAESHYGLGNALTKEGDTESAIREYLEAIRIRPDYAEAHCNVGIALSMQSRFSEALRSLRKGHELGSMRSHWDYPSGKWVEDAEFNVEFERRLDRMLSGAELPRNAVERVAFAQLLYRDSRYAESARMYAESFAEDAELAQDHRYNAACSASLEAARGGVDVAEWRGRALEWLSADLEAREWAATDLASTLEHWKQDPDLASVRDHLGDLPEPERAAWRGHWAAVDLALSTALSAAK